MRGRYEPRNGTDLFDFQGGSEGPDSGSNWSDLLIPGLPSTEFDAALSGVLRSTTEMEKIKGLEAQEFQRVIDVLGQVSTIFGPVFSIR